MRILFLSPYLPSRIRVRPYHWIRELARAGHEVHLVSLAPPDDRAGPDEALHAACSRIEVFPLGRARTLFNAALAVPERNTPLQLAYSRHVRAARRVEELAATGRFDVIHIEHMRGVPLASRIRGVPVVFDAVDSISTLFAEAAQHGPTARSRLIARLDLARSRRFEAGAPSMFARVVVTSDREAAAFLALAGPHVRNRLAVLGNGVDTDYFRPGESNDGRTVVFTGKLSYHANAAAAVHLVSRIMPVVWAEAPDTRVVLAGKDPPDFVRALARDARVEVTGYVQHLPAVFAAATVAVCPLVYGVGIQNKVLEALASGVPTVMTTDAAQSLGGAAGRDYLAERTDDDMARSILKLLADRRLRRELARRGREYVVRTHQWDRLAESLVGVYESAVGVSSMSGPFKMPARA